MTKALETVSEENYARLVVPGGNSSSWLLGHLADTDDALLPLLGIGERIHPELKTIYHHERGSNQSGIYPRPNCYGDGKKRQLPLTRPSAPGLNRIG